MTLFKKEHLVMAKSSKAIGAKRHVKVKNLQASEKELTQREANKVKGGWRGPITLATSEISGESLAAANTFQSSVSLKGK
jgi:hypothetical protein